MYYNTRHELPKADYMAPKFTSRQRGQRVKELCPIEVVNAGKNGHTRQKIDVHHVILVIYDASLQHNPYERNNLVTTLSTL